MVGTNVSRVNINKNIITKVYFIKIASAVHFFKFYFW